MNELMTQENREVQLALAQSFIKNVNDDLRDIKHRFFRIGFYLSEANKNKYYEALGYDSIESLAEQEFQLGKSSAYDLMRIYELFHNWKQPMQIEPAYEDYSQTQLREFCRAKVVIDFCHIVKPTDTVEDTKRFISTLNKYCYNSRWRSDFKSIDEVFDIFDIPRKKQIAAPAPLLEPQPNLIELAEEPAEQEEDFSTQVENEPEESAEELKELPASNCYGGEDYSQYEDECTRVKNVSDDEVINYALKVGTFFKNGKFRIYDKFNEPATKAAFVEYVQKEYGAGGVKNRNWQFIYEINTTKVGMTVTCISGRRIDLPWAYVAGRISRLIETNQYLSVEEHAQFVQWKAEQDGLIVNMAAPAKPSKFEALEVGKKTNWEYLQTVTSKSLFLHLVSEGVNSIPEGFGEGMPDRIRKWLQIWLEKPVEL